MNSVLSLSEEQAAKGVVVHSSGNHAAAVALAAKIRGIPAHIVLPTDAPQVCHTCDLETSLQLASYLLGANQSCLALDCSGDILPITPK